MHLIHFFIDNASFLTTFGEDAKVFTPISHLGALTNISHFTNFNLLSNNEEQLIDESH